MLKNTMCNHSVFNMINNIAKLYNNLELMSNDKVKYLCA